MGKRLNKRGQELSIGTLILIVLGIVVLVLLILGFSIGWEKLFGIIGIYQGSDLTSIVSACNIAVSSQSKASYCEFKRVTLDDTDQYVNCEDSRVVGELNEKLDACPVKGGLTAGDVFCNSLKEKDTQINKKVNGKDCKA